MGNLYICVCVRVFVLLIFADRIGLNDSDCVILLPRFWAHCTQPEMLHHTKIEAYAKQKTTGDFLLVVP